MLMFISVLVVFMLSLSVKTVVVLFDKIGGDVEEAIENSEDLPQDVQGGEDSKGMLHVVTVLGYCEKSEYSVASDRS